MIPDHDLVETFLTPVRICSAYRPAFGHSDSEGVDSKRQNADLRFGMSAYQEGLLPAFMILSQQVSETVIDRYRKDKMAVLTGTLDGDSLSSTFTFFKQVVGFDLESFFRRNSETLKTETLTIIQALLRAD